MAHATTNIEYKKVMFWELFIEEFGPNIQHIYGVDNILSGKISRLTPQNNIQ